MLLKNMLFLLLIVLLFSFSSCENTTDENNKIITPFVGGPSFVLDEIINEMIYDQSSGPINAYQIASKSLGVININAPQIVPYTDDYSASIYKIGSRAEFIEYSKCLGYTLNAKTGYLPHKYFLDWTDTPLVGGENVSWQFKYPNLPEVNTSVPMPSDFGNLNVNSTYLDIFLGGTLTWENTGSEDLILAASLAFAKPNGDLDGGVRTSFVDFIPNSGSFIITPQLLSDLGADSLCINVSFYFGKANIKITKFDNDTKQVATIGYVEQSISMPTTIVQ